MKDQAIKQVGAIDETKKTSAIVPKGDKPGPENTCFWNGVVYGEGDTVCSNHHLLRCNLGSWHEAGNC